MPFATNRRGFVRWNATRGFMAQDNKCVKVACDSGYAVSDKGICEPLKSREKARETSRSAPEKRRAAEQEPRNRTPNARQSGSGSAICLRPLQPARRGQERRLLCPESFGWD